MSALLETVYGYWVHVLKTYFLHDSSPEEKGGDILTALIFPLLFFIEKQLNNSIFLSRALRAGLPRRNMFSYLLFPMEMMFRQTQVTLDTHQ